MTVERNAILFAAAQITALKPSCECDGDGSYCCPLHNLCDCCGDALGIRKDRTLTYGSRKAWVCQACYDLCDQCGENPCKCAPVVADADPMDAYTGRDWDLETKEVGL